MSNVSNEDSPTPGEEQGKEKAEEPRAKTPLEMVREGQAKMRGNRTNSGRVSSEGDGSGAVDSYKRRLHQRKSG